LTDHKETTSPRQCQGHSHWPPRVNYQRLQEVRSQINTDGLKRLSTQSIGKLMAPPSKPLQPGRKLQISKYAHEWTPTTHHHNTTLSPGRLATKSTCCFACGNLKQGVRQAHTTMSK
jgi:hypothetical protein